MLIVIRIRIKKAKLFQSFSGRLYILNKVRLGSLFQQVRATQAVRVFSK